MLWWRLRQVLHLASRSVHRGTQLPIRDPLLGKRRRARLSTAVMQDNKHTYALNVSTTFLSLGAERDHCLSVALAMNRKARSPCAHASSNASRLVDYCQVGASSS